MWHHLAPALAETHKVVCMDMRGYGWSTAPKSDAKHETYSKRAMAKDVIQVMEALGMCISRLSDMTAERVSAIVSLSTIPAAWSVSRCSTSCRPITCGSRCTRANSRAHWGYLSQPYPKPEKEIGRDPIPYFEGLLRKWSAAGDLDAFDPRALESYWQSCNEPTRIHAFCEDYRAGATRDVEADEADLAVGKTIQCPTYLIWSDFYLVSGPMGHEQQPLEIWRRSFAPKAHGVGHQLRAISWRRKTPARHWRRCRHF